MKRNSVLTSMALLMLVIGNIHESKAQTNDSRILNTVTTAVPFLRIAPDARGGGMGDMGIGFSPDPNGWFYSPAKMAFAKNDMGFSVTYTPWLKQLVNDIYLASVYGFKRIDDAQTIGGSLRYFSLGTIQFTDVNGNHIRDFRPNEFALDAGYARKLSDVFSTGLMLRFIYSNLATGQQVNSVDIKPGTSVAADVSFHYQNKDMKIGGNDAVLGVGLNLSNIGAKITYTDDAQNKDFIPANLGLGTALEINLNEYNAISFGVDFNKLLVPTPDTVDFKDQSVPASIFSSFTDAPGGFSEEIRETTFSVGAEYWYDQQFAVRAGYFYENQYKGNRQFLTVGLGLRYQVFGINFSYLVPTNAQRNPLDNTLRFSLLFNFEEAGKKE